jgi:hypothetical protein
MPPGAASFGRFENVMGFARHGKMLREHEQSPFDQVQVREELGLR